MYGFENCQFCGAHKGGGEAMSDETLKPCPFCGGEAEMCHVTQLWEPRDAYWVKCKNCRISGTHHTTEAEAIAAWNSRADYHGYEQAAIEAWESIKAWNSRAERTCKQEERGWCTEGDHARVWLTCGHDCMVPTVQDLPNYCPNCGARVVE